MFPLIKNDCKLLMIPNSQSYPSENRAIIISALEIADINNLGGHSTQHQRHFQKSRPLHTPPSQWSDMIIASVVTIIKLI